MKIHVESLSPWYRPRPPKPVAPALKTDKGFAQESPMLTRLRAQKQKKKIGYETDVPRCANCANYRSAHTFLVNSMPHHVPRRCIKFSIQVDTLACCDHWVGTKGEALE